VRRIAIALMSTISGLVLLFSYHTSRGPAGGGGAEGSGALSPSLAAQLGEAAAADGGTPTADSAGAGASPSPGPSTTGAPSTTAPPATTTKKAPGGTSGTFTGTTVQTQWGPVQVRITLQNGRIVKAQAIKFPNDNHHDIEINSWAVPQLQEATVQANSAQIDSLSGATVTSGGYIASLQSAIDKAHR